MVLKTSFTFLVVAALAVLSSYTPQAEAHSWADCIDWRFNKPGKQDWSNNGGKCMGYARRFPLGKGFGTLDSMGRHYQQNRGNPDKALPCANHKEGHKPDIGLDETRANPPSKAYGGKHGQMTVTKVGDTLCVRWPAKNHADQKKDPRKTTVQIYLSKSKDSVDPKYQQDLFKNKVADLPFHNCNPGKDEDKRPCGGCFKVPVRAKGTYLLQWRWLLNKEDNEWYTSCADIEIK
ncbi:hypothetical protein BGX29_007604 [Mortierella sp. GBA35]|nr:hypothetical protein BGX23_006876 [Mortierella sp. AD031]KAF9098475.1 hypothetical protein BGX29_007604 [Mortierella sp. GBA35]KAG0219429.1 hypothetical protein BGX33_003018 [Mortierella sp. NVP41]